MLRITWLTVQKLKGKPAPAETFGTLHLSDRYADGKIRMIMKDKEGSEFMLCAAEVEVGEGEHKEKAIQVFFEPIQQP